MQSNSGFLGDCSAEQTKVLEAFKKELATMGVKDPRYDDAFLLRFCRARKFKLDKILEMFKKYLNWRVEQGVDNIASFDFKELPEVRKVYPHGYFRTDRIGRPVYIERIGKLDIKALYKLTTPERLMKYYIQGYERIINEILPACSKAAGKRIEQSVTIFDLQGASMKLMSGQVYDFIKIASSIGQDYYPETLGQMFIINAPLLFSGVWAMIKPWLDDKTKSKIKILGSSYAKELATVIDPQNLPDFLGGKATVKDYGEYLHLEQGPWKDLKTEDKQDVKEQPKVEDEKVKVNQEDEKVKVEPTVDADAEAAFVNNQMEGLQIESDDQFQKEFAEAEKNAELHPEQALAQDENEETATKS